MANIHPTIRFLLILVTLTNPIFSEKKPEPAQIEDNAVRHLLDLCAFYEDLKAYQTDFHVQVDYPIPVIKPSPMFRYPGVVGMFVNIIEALVQSALIYSSSFSDYENFTNTYNPGALQGGETGTLKLQRPNFFRFDYGKAGHQKFFIADGERATYLDTNTNKFIQYSTPKEFNVKMKTRRYGSLRRFLRNFSGIYPLLCITTYPRFMDDAKKLLYVGLEETSGEICHHLQAEYESLRVDVWFRSEGDPWLLKSSQTELIPAEFKEVSDENNFLYPTVTLHYKNWQAKENFPKEIFKANIPESGTNLREIQEAEELGWEKSFQPDIKRLFSNQETLEATIEPILATLPSLNADQDAYTWKKYYIKEAAFYTQLFKSNLLKKNEDPIALQKREAYIRPFAMFLQLRPSSDEIHRMINEGDQLLKSGCNDPVVRMCYGMALRRFGKHRQGIEQFESAIKQLRERGGSPALLGLAAMHNAECHMRISS